LVTCTLAFVASCSSAGAPEEPIENGTATLAEGLRRPGGGGVGPRPKPPEADPCAAVRCAAGTHCEVVDDGAICADDASTSPCALVLCPPDTQCEVVVGEASCTPIEPPPGGGPFCGGFAGIACPGAGSCVDDPTDDCDPERGGADCGGTCACQVLALCVEGSVFDDSPEVCACVPAPESDPCALVDCPPDRPRCEVVDGEGVCREAPPAPDGPFCGGFAGIQCPGAGSCIDDPTDDCDPERGGFDCGGVCACQALALCIEGTIFDDSADVCACVPDPCTTTLLLCAPGTSCQAIDGEPVCTPIEPNPCAVVLCPTNTTCDVVDGEAVCTPLEPTDPCATVLCARGSRCVAHGDRAHCLPRGAECRHER
jgi:hypothetical protein